MEYKIKKYKTKGGKESYYIQMFDEHGFSHMGGRATSIPEAQAKIRELKKQYGDQMITKTEKAINKVIKLLVTAKKEIRAGEYGFAIGNEVRDAKMFLDEVRRIGEKEFELVFE